MLRNGLADRITPTAVLTLLLLSVTAAAADDWPVASGPNHNFVIDGTTPNEFSVSRNEGVIWRAKLPNTGESTPIVSGNRIFVTCHAPISKDGEHGSTIIALCFDANIGKELWRRELPGSRITDMASGFSDNTAASPVTDGKHVCFVNVGGSVRTYDFDGNLIWKHDWVPFGRHHARQHEPMLHAGNVVLMRVAARTLPKSATTKPGAKKLGEEKAHWTHLFAYDLATGKETWRAECGTSVHSTSMLGMVDNRPVILTGRGGGHQPLERPYGLTMLDAKTGRTVWDLSLKGYAAHQNTVFNNATAACFVGMNHHTLDVKNGERLQSVSIDSNVSICRHTENGYQTSIQDLPKARRKKPITYQTNILIGSYHYFRAHNHPFLGRLHLPTGKVEYLQVPVQVVRQSRKPDQFLWDMALLNDVKNNDGYVVCSDKRAMRDGWGHVSAASPIVVGDHLYMPTMVGTVYVIKWNAKTLNESALVSISDLGPAQRTWTLSSLASAKNRLYARTLKELICIGK